MYGFDYIELSRMKKIHIFCFAALLFCFPLIPAAQNTDSILNMYRNNRGIYNTDSLLAKSKLMMFANPEKSSEMTSFGMMQPP